MKVIIDVLIIALSITIIFLPTFIALKRNRAKALSIFLMNLWLWPYALLRALQVEKKRKNRNSYFTFRRPTD